MTTPAEQYAEDRATVKADMEQAVTLEFGEYVGYLAHYGIKLWKLADKHPARELAHRHLQNYADEVLDELAARQ
ncbi:MULTISPECIES: hypothetical protein [Streptomyces]|uniref:Uncharacterized protein n=2 Tax=Streptomyces TaxID=1883 RepID=A0A646KKR0_STRJU|nr:MULTISPECIES: hypothetical protein [Streptomyces]MQT02894.1 hypothetical protein [Streptomyces jumonjinensis]BDT39671.1 hypothetical protein SYYSPA8_37765 [Streptomyces sp. YSPA8]